jgi:hypothetical protein
MFQFGTKRKFANVVALPAFECVEAATMPAVSRPTRLSERAMHKDLETAGFARRTSDDTLPDSRETPMMPTWP